MEELIRLVARALLRAGQEPANPQAGPDTALIVASYNAARTEIIERMKLREGIIVAFVTASVTVFGAVIAFKGIEPLDAIKLYYVTPALSLIVAVAIRQHNEAIESLAQFLRANFDSYFRDGGRALQWDTYTRQTDIEKAKTSWRLRYHLLALHGPCLVSLMTGWSHLIHMLDRPAALGGFPVRLTLAIAATGTIAWMLAAFTTFRSFRIRGVALGSTGWVVGLIGVILLLVIGVAVLLAG